MRPYLAGLTLILLTATVAAQATPFDCAGSEPHRQFDFWLGDWEVLDTEGNLQGHNRITSVEAGCALVEQWRSAKGGTGRSLNYFDPATGKWRQLWVDAGASIIDISGGLDSGSMALEGQIYYLQTQRSHPFRGEWTPLPDGRVRQFFQQQDEAGQWQTWFEGFYRRVES